ncbi:MAG: phage/plasmid primase, P4 family [Armatimonadota bacterium]
MRFNDLESGPGSETQDRGQWVLRYVKLGYPVIPLHTAKVGTNNKLFCSCSAGLTCQHMGKHPRTAHGLKDASVNVDHVYQWWRQWPDANIGIRTGAVPSGAGFIVLDVDDHAMGEGVSGYDSLRQLETTHGPLPVTLTAITGSGGHHFFFALPAGVKIASSAGRLGAGLDIRGEGGYIVAAPSLHASGGNYAWDNWGVEMAEAPEWLIKLANTKERAAELPPGQAGQIPMGQRNTALTRLAGVMHSKGFPGEAIEAALLRTNQACCIPPLADEEVVAIVHSIQRYAEGTPCMLTPYAGGSPPLTDLGNAELLIRLHRDDMRYNYSDGRWHFWRDTHWAPDMTEQVKRWAHEVIRQMMGEAEAVEDDSIRKAVQKHTRWSESERGTRAMLAQAQPYLGLTTEVLDCDRWLLNCLNGTIDLRSGELHPHRREDYNTKIVPVTYDPNASCPNWWKFLLRVFDQNADLIAYVQRAAGYSVTADVSEQCLFFLYGSGRNGKSTFIETLVRILGNYQVKAPTEMLMAKPYGAGIPNDIARLPGVRMVVAAEIEAGRRLAESRVKDLTGGDTLTARFLHKEFFDFPPTHKLWIYGNHKPTVRGTDEGIWRRIQLIPFTVEIPVDECDPHFREKFLEPELTGILTWIVQGCLRWQEHQGLKPPDEVVAATQAYRNEMDVLTAFIEECCTLGNGYQVQSSALYVRYKAWCEQLGEHPISHRAFGEELRRRGLEHKHRNTGEYWIGIGLLDINESPAVA